MNPVTLQKLVGTEPACAAIKAGGVQTILECVTFFTARRCVCYLGEQVVPVLAAAVCNLQMSVLLWKL